MASSHHGGEVDLQIEKKNHCVFTLQELGRMAVYINQYFSTLFGMQTYFQSTQTSVAHPTYVL